eukprot:scaffold115688_cov18-Tisochrysis_lutea.AAC.1
MQQGHTAAPCGSQTSQQRQPSQACCVQQLLPCGGRSGRRWGCVRVGCVPRWQGGEVRGGGCAVAADGA